MKVKDLMTELYKMAVKNPKILEMQFLTSDFYRNWYNISSIKLVRVDNGIETDEPNEGQLVLGSKVI